MPGSMPWKLDVGKETPEGREKRIASSVKSRRARRRLLKAIVPDPVTTDREYSDAELEFIRAVDAYITATHRPFPTACELLQIAIGLGYHKA